MQNSYILILAIGMVLCILTGGNIDLSVGSIVALVSASSALFSVVWNIPVPIAIVFFVGESDYWQVCGKDSGLLM